MRTFFILLIFPTLAFSQIKSDEVQSLFQHKQFVEAEQFIVNYLDQNPKDLRAIELLGDAYGHQKKWEAAINKYKALTVAIPNNATYHFKYGGALGMKALSGSKMSALGSIGDIKDAFLKAAQLDPSHIDVRWALVELYMQLPGILGGSKSKSLEYANELENLSAVDGYLAKGYIYEYDDEPELAEKYYKKAIKLGGSLTCFGKLTGLYEHNDQPEKAITTIEEAQKTHQRNALHYQIGKVSAEYNVELQKGEACLQTYIKNFSARDAVPKAWANFRLAQINLHKKNKPEALKYIDLALLELPEIEPFKEEKERILSL